MYLKYCCHEYYYYVYISIIIININKYEKTRLAEVCILPLGTKTQIDNSFMME